jgi:hypothetical protein
MGFIHVWKLDTQRRELLNKSVRFGLRRKTREKYVLESEGILWEINRQVREQRDADFKRMKVNRKSK